MQDPGPAADEVLDRLCDLYMRSNRALVDVRQAKLELGGAEGGLMPVTLPGGAARSAQNEQFDELGQATALAKELHTKCSLAVAAALVARVQMALRRP